MIAQTLFATTDASSFDAMAENYDVANAMSMGITDRARRRTIAQLPRRSGARIAVYMSGTGLDVRPVLRRFPDAQRITCVDNSTVMNHVASLRLAHVTAPVVVLHADVLHHPLADGSQDAVVMNFGAKTLSSDELERLAERIHRVLVPGGSFVGCELACTGRWWIDRPVRFQARCMIPFVAALRSSDPRVFAKLWDHMRDFDHPRMMDVFSLLFHMRSLPLFGGLVRVYRGDRKA